MTSRIIACACMTAIPLLAGAAHGETVRAGRLTISDSWARETAPGQSVGGGFMAITNTGKSADRLVSGSTPAAAELQIHSMVMNGAVMQMRELKAGLEIPAGGSVTLKPGSFHLMFMGLKAPLQRGKTIPVTLQFARAGKVKVQVAIQPVGSLQFKGPAHDRD